MQRWVLPKGRDAKSIHQEVIDGRMCPERFAKYTGEIRRLFEKRDQVMDPALDALLSFTTSIGQQQHGLALPA